MIHIKVGNHRCLAGLGGGGQFLKRIRCLSTCHSGKKIVNQIVPRIGRIVQLCFFRTNQFRIADAGVPFVAVNVFVKVAVPHCCSRSSAGRIARCFSRQNPAFISIGIKHVIVHDRLEIGLTIARFGTVSGFIQSRHQHCCQNCDDRNDNKKFNESKVDCKDRGKFLFPA